MKYSDDIISIKGIGDKTAKLFYRMGIYTVKDLLEFYPRDYQTFENPIPISKARDGDVVTLELVIPSAFKWKRVRNLSIGTGAGSDGTDLVSITYFNAPYLKRQLTAGSTYLFRGKIKKQNGK